MMDFTQFVGMAAGAATTLAFVPQVLMVWKSRSAKDISLGMYLIFTFGIILWLIYGVLNEDLPLVIANAITLILASSVLFMKLLFDYKRHK